MFKLNKSQAAVLKTAAGRRDHLLVSPEALAERSVKALGTALLNLGLVAEVQVKAKQPAWRTGEDGTRVGLALTEAGLQAVRAQAGGGPDEAPADAATEPAPSRQGPAPTPADTAGSGRGTLAGAPRGGTKQALILSLLSRPEGATLDDLLSATGWLPHTTRAALTGLRHKGYEFIRSKNAAGETVYRTADRAEAAGEGLGEGHPNASEAA